jgi:hypothetical protein
MKSLSSLMTFIGLLISVSAHAQCVDTTPIRSDGAIVTGAPHAPACHGKPDARTKTASQASVHKSAVSGIVRSVRNIPSECSSCPLVATCYPT